MPDKPIEIHTHHRCLLGVLTDTLAERAASGTRGEELAGIAWELLRQLDASAFAACCMPAYLALAPQRFDREVQVPIACADVAELDTRVLLWPIGSADGEHPHRDGWAAVMMAGGTLTASETQNGRRLPERPLTRGVPELIHPVEGVSHHIHNRGRDVGLTVHIFGK